MKYFIITGEASGDLHGSNLIKELKQLDVNAQIRCWGGEMMEVAGAYLDRHYKEYSIMGFVEVLKKIISIIKLIKICKLNILDFRPDGLILIDFPGFNLKIARWAKKNKISVIYYIPPQLWAWNTSRIKIIKKNVDKVISIFPFEKNFYKAYNYDVEYVGHPLLDILPETNNSDAEKQRLIALLPGSRKQEIKHILPIMTSIIPYFPDYTFIVAGLNTIEKDFYTKHMTYKCQIAFNETYSILSRAQAAIVASGTATLETALLNTPMVVCYKGSLISYYIARMLIKVPYISIVNLILNKQVVTELIQHKFNTDNLCKELNNILFNQNKQVSILNEYENLRKLLGQKGASYRAAKIIYQYLNNLNYEVN